MLAVLVVISAVFLIQPIVQNYPDNARVFPQMTASVVFVGSLLLLVQNYLPGVLQTIVAESVNITTDDSPSEAEEELASHEEEAETEEELTPREEEVDSAGPKRTLGQEYGYEINDTVFMMVASTLYFFAGWAAGFLFVTPLFVFGYTTWFRARSLIRIGLAALATAIIYLFIEFLVMPFDQGAIFDFSPFLPAVIEPITLIVGVL